MPATHLPMTPRTATARTVLALLLLAAVSACGQKGPLYLPERTPMVIGDDADEDAAQPAAAPGASDVSEAGRAADEDDDDRGGDPRRGAPEPGP